jgi:hypothetical protein
LKSRAIIHTEIEEYVKENESKKVKMGTALKVGNVIHFRFVLFYASSKFEDIINVQYYENFEVKELPYWMKFT